ncbi:MAG: glycoside hydrolase family 1 protein [Candidatus Lokiarchaeota archaeon]|nr:glycoside hydrolase family 1 protein [Candidatus Lokiarchaeota archaeon]
MVEKKINFPKDFLWGIATSSYQVEGNNNNSDWWEFEQFPGNIKTGEQSGMATNHWNLYEEDFQLVKDMNCNIFRMSVEWSRIFPKEGEINSKAIKHYHQMFDWLIKNNIKIMLTIHHFTLPLWFSKKGGLENERNIVYYQDFVRLLAKEFKEKIDYWCTINEPIILAMLAYKWGFFPPCEKDTGKMEQVINNLLRMHASAYKILKIKNSIKSVGIVKAVEEFIVLSNREDDHEKAKEADNVMNSSFFNSLKTGYLPYGSKEFIPNLKESFDFIGINYYHRSYISSEHFPEIFSTKLPNADPKYLFTEHEWQPYPAGIFNILKRVSKLTEKPIFITENGISTENDDWRKYFIISHLIEIFRATQNNINVKGYIHWALTDNFEWVWGFRPRFGLVHIDYNNFERKLKESGKLYGKICSTNSIEFSDTEILIKLFPDIHESMKISKNMFD